MKLIKFLFLFILLFQANSVSPMQTNWTGSVFNHLREIAQAIPRICENSMKNVENFCKSHPYVLIGIFAVPLIYILYKDHTIKKSNSHNVPVTIANTTLARIEKRQQKSELISRLKKFIEKGRFNENKFVKKIKRYSYSLPIKWTKSNQITPIIREFARLLRQENPNNVLQLQLKVNEIANILNIVPPFSC